MKFALEQSTCHNYIIVYTDEFRFLDGYDLALKNDIIRLRDERKSCIFFVPIVTQGNMMYLPQFNQTVENVGHMITLDLMVGQGQGINETMRKILDLTKNCSVCQETC